MTRLLHRSRRAVGPEIDNVLEHEAGLRSLADACRLLGMDTPALLALLARGGLPNAFRKKDHWRIPLEDIRRHLAVAGIGNPDPTGVLARHRRPFDAAEPRPSAGLTPAERRTFIVDRLAADRFVRVTRLSAELGVSQMTVRRDLRELESERLLIRTHGGAMTAVRPPLAALLPAPSAEPPGC